MPTYSEPSLLGLQPPDFSLKGVDGLVHHLADFENSKALVIVFMCNHCPYVKATLGRINKLAQKYSEKGVQVVGINSNDSTLYPEDSWDEMKRLSETFPLSFPYLWDESQEVAHAYQAVCTPEFFVYGPSPDKREKKMYLEYHGRLDDQWKDEAQVTHADLEVALDYILRFENPPSDQKPAMGCSIKWR